MVLAVGEGELEQLLAAADEASVDALPIGSAGGDRISISAAELDVSLLLADAERAWRSLDQRL